FFLQAEDGIRDKLVTGVQTCALPIFYRAHVDEPRLAVLGLEGGAGGDRTGRRGYSGRLDQRTWATGASCVVDSHHRPSGRLGERSEERRVGKGWRAGGVRGR